MEKSHFTQKFKAKRMNLRLPYVAQGKESGNCGPCSIKMIADYYGVKKETGKCILTGAPSEHRVIFARAY